MPEKVILLLGTVFSLAYAIINDNPALIINYGPLFALDLIALLMRLYYVVLNNKRNKLIQSSVMIQTDFVPITISIVSMD